MKSFALSLASLCAVAGLCLAQLHCAPKPTKTRETRRPPTIKAPNAREEKALWLARVQKDECALLDSRSLYEFQLKRVPGAVHVRWQDFADTGAKSKGVLSNSLDDIAQRLALIGVSPNRCAVIFTDNNSIGEDGRLAWTLAYLGVQEIQILNRADYPELFIGPLDKGVKNAPYWKPSPRENLRMTAAQFNSIAPSTVRVLDVRTAQERKITPLSPNLAAHAVNISASEFYTGRRFKTEMIWELEKAGVTKAQKLVVVSRDGVDGAGVVFYLSRLGYQVALLEAGLESLQTGR